MRYRGRESVTTEKYMWYFKQDYNEDLVDFFKREVDEDIEGRKNSIKKLQVDLETYENLLNEKEENGRFINLSERDKEEIRLCMKKNKIQFKYIERRRCVCMKVELVRNSEFEKLIEKH